MRSFVLSSTLIACCWLASTAQSPFKPQLAIPVHIGGMAQPVSNIAKQAPYTYLSGIALMFFDSSNTTDEFLVTGGSDLVVWHDCIGKSTKLTFIVPDSQFIGRLELMYFDAKCTADLWWQDRFTGATSHATGDLLSDESGYSLHFTLTDKATKNLGDIFYPLNVQLMELHARDIRKVEVKSWFNRDSINVIVGEDSQFDTNYELFWLDQALRTRLHALASNSYSKLVLFGGNDTVRQDSVQNKNRMIHNRVERTKGGLKGTMTITLKPDASARYVFLKPFHTYRMFVDYTFLHAKNRPGQMSIQRIGLRDTNNGDFVEMDLYDFVNNGLPVIYVDLIRGVVTSVDPWDIANVIHAVEDVVGASRLPME